ncbi:Gluconate kinase [Klebsormidium nitens]|uniref:gluconokinase n=1 Tax=Klebsormidium nitens TaxID=105231 RepID=A0A1Y1HSM9_KLENI|nr:Gluconate kinase [Klebsormidium nitens]|eukprot:GAQ78828.1 Gluconate kinase [Klebsormidium nitens]
MENEDSGSSPPSTTGRVAVVPTAVICMGVSGAGKTTVGKVLAEMLKCEFLDADDFHSLQNKDKMRRGIPLIDEDRAPWLETLRQLLRERLVEGKNVVLACSALKPEYRTILRAAASDFGHEQAQAVGASLDDDSAYVDGIAKAACRGSSLENGQGFKEDRSSDCEDPEFGEVKEADRRALPRVVFVHLKADAKVLAARLKAREKAGTHYMPASLLESQMQALQIYDGEAGIMTEDAELTPNILARQVLKNCKL